MRKKIIFFIIILSIIILHISTMVEAARYDPGLNWQVLESPHFSVYFSMAENNEQLAQQIADIAEEAYQQVNAQLGSPDKHNHLQKIAIIMEDFSDYALGFASSFPHRVIRLSLTGPTAKSFDMKFKSWLKMVITHEYTHIAHFEMTAGSTTALRALFGQILVPNGLQPIWSIEGLAVYNETKFTTGGRGIDSRYDMYLRMAALEEQFNTLDQINGYYLTSWPDGTAPYIYGQSIIHFIAQKYGEDKVIALSKIFCEYPYLGFNHAIKRAIGMNLEELYQSWKDNLKEKYQLQMQKVLSQKNFTPSQQLTEYHYWVDYPRWIPNPTTTPAPDGDEESKIAVRVSTPHSYPSIQIIDPLNPSLPLTPHSTKNRTEAQPLIKRTYGRDSSFSISPDGSKIIYAKLGDYEQFNKFYDLYLFDLETEKETRLSEGLRARDPNWSPDPDPDNPQIVAVINQSGTNNLALINLPSSSLGTNSSINENQHVYKPITKEDIIYLTDFRDGTQLSQPSWSPDGKMIALAAWRYGYQDIYILDLDSDNLNPENIGNSILQPIFYDTPIDLSPCWSPDGKYLFFSSERTGIYNIFAFSLSDKKLYQITNVLGGAFQPAVSPDGTQLAFISYHATGYELHLMEVKANLNSNSIPNPDDPNQWTEVGIEYTEPPITIMAVAEQQFNKDPQTSPNSKNNYPIHPYNSLSSFWPPTYWIPAAQLTKNGMGIGFSTELKDVLGFHSLPLSITYGMLNNNLNYNFNYYNYNYLPIINLYLSGNAVLAPQTQTPTSWWEEGKTGINIIFPYKGYTASAINSRSYRQIFSLGYQYEKSSTANTNGTTDTNDTGTSFPLNTTNPKKITSLKLGYSYSDAEKYGFSISPELGNSFSLTYEHADKALGGDYTFDKLLFDVRKFIPLPPLHQVLALRLVAGTSSSSILESDLDGEKFKLGGSYSADNLSNIDVNIFSLRGYKPTAFKGNNLLLTSLEYRFPLANIEHSLKLGPLSIFLERLSGALFFDMGNAWESPGTSIWQDFKYSIGAELKADFNQKYDFPFTLRLGAAKALTVPHGYDIYITLGSSF
mgnify:CR=1 FL=1